MLSFVKYSFHFYLFLYVCESHCISLRFKEVLFLAQALTISLIERHVGSSFFRDNCKIPDNASERNSVN